MKRDLPKDRPPPLKITRPGDPQQLDHPQQQQQQRHVPLPHGHHRQPIIIHTYSPEVIQIDSNNFRQLVQRLTGPGSHTPPPPKRPRHTRVPSLPPILPPAPPFNRNFNPHDPSFAARPSLRGQMLQELVPSPRGYRPLQQQQQDADRSHVDLPHHPLLFLSPSLLPSPSSFAFDFLSPLATASPRGAGPGLLPSPRGLPPPSPLGQRGYPTPRSLAAALPSPGLLGSPLFPDLPLLSPSTYGWIERNGSLAESVLSPRPFMSANLPPRPRRPPTTTANFFPHEGGSLAEEDEKPFLYTDRRT
ncbi:hypothetical protein KP509_17G067400 [Ceratopteris richardii]|uniref:VQ domain-containing protein n=1 Tax=Ceratopteris richardii TaxID=49495 RepID=A0A8T2SVV3_CERRI|nr:hypothetical protein KP509_17G067400 [Ceratopteris richardii]